MNLFVIIKFFILLETINSSSFITSMILQVLSITPSKDASTPLSTPGSEVVSRKRSDIDFDAFSDAKRRKTEKGKIIENTQKSFDSYIKVYNIVLL